MMPISTNLKFSNFSHTQLKTGSIAMYVDLHQNCDSWLKIFVTQRHFKLVSVKLGELLG